MVGNVPVPLRRRVAVQAVRRRRWECRGTAPLPCVRTSDGKDKNRTVSFEVALLKTYPLLIYGRSCIVPLSTSREFFATQDHSFVVAMGARRTHWNGQRPLKNHGPNPNLS